MFVILIGIFIPAPVLLVLRFLYFVVSEYFFSSSAAPLATQRTSAILEEPHDSN